MLLARETFVTYLYIYIYIYIYSLIIIIVDKITFKMTKAAPIWNNFCSRGKLIGLRRSSHCNPMVLTKDVNLNQKIAFAITSPEILQLAFIYLL